MHFYKMKFVFRFASSKAFKAKSSIKAVKADRLSKIAGTNAGLNDLLKSIDTNAIATDANPFGEISASAEENVMEALEKELVQTRRLKHIAQLRQADIRFGPKIVETMNKKSNTMLLEGTRLINSAIAAQVTFRNIFFTDRSALERLVSIPEECDLHQITREALDVWTDVQTSQGIMAICDKPDYELIRINQNKVNHGLSVICENLRDPGNMGTIIRTCAAAGCEKLITTKGCVNVWERKVLRSGMGGHFSLKIETAKDNGETFDSHKYTFIVAVNRDVEFDDKRSMSLNRLGNWANERAVAIVIGGETHGIPNRIFKLENAVFVRIPMFNNIESLNSSVACSVILYTILASKKGVE